MAWGGGGGSSCGIVCIVAIQMSIFSQSAYASRVKYMYIHAALWSFKVSRVIMSTPMYTHNSMGTYSTRYKIICH